LQPVTFKMIRDGLSQTIFIGEKHVLLGSFGKGKLDSSIYNGDYPLPCSRGAGPSFPLAKTPMDAPSASHPNDGMGFGSYHPGVCHFLLGDGSVRAISIDIAPLTMAHLANIADGNVLPDF
jgi:hypothetical protein